MDIIKKNFKLFVVSIFILFYLVTLFIPSDLFNEFNILLINDDVFYGGYINTKALKFYLFDTINLLILILMFVVLFLKKEKVLSLLSVLGITNNLINLIIFIVYFTTNAKNGTSYESVSYLYNSYSIYFCVFSLLLFIDFLLISFIKNPKIINNIVPISILLFAILLISLPTRGEYIETICQLPKASTEGCLTSKEYGINYYLHIDFLVFLLSSIFYLIVKLLKKNNLVFISCILLICSSLYILISAIMHENSLVLTSTAFPISLYSRSELSFGIGILLVSIILLIKEKNNNWLIYM